MCFTSFYLLTLFLWLLGVSLLVRAGYSFFSAFFDDLAAGCENFLPELVCEGAAAVTGLARPKLAERETAGL